GKLGAEGDAAHRLRMRGLVVDLGSEIEAVLGVGSEPPRLRLQPLAVALPGLARLQPAEAPIELIDGCMKRRFQRLFASHASDGIPGALIGTGLLLAEHERVEPRDHDRPLESAAMRVTTKQGASDRLVRLDVLGEPAERVE